MNDKELVKWSSEKQSLISRYVNLLLNILDIGDDGRVTTAKGFYLDVYLKIISENISIDGIDTVDVKRGLIYRAFFTRLKLYKQQDIHTFRRAVASEARRFLARPVQDYWILLPLHVPFNQLGNSRSITIFNTKLLIRNWDYVQNKFDFNEFSTKTRHQIGDQDFFYFDKFSPILVKTRGRYPAEAFYYAERPYDFLRWLINLIYQFGRITTRWGGYPKPLGMMLPPPTYAVFNQDGKFEQLFYTISRYKDYQRNTLEPQVLLEVRKLARRLNLPTDDKQTINILIGALEKYGEALDTFEWRLAFLLLWQILELVTLQSSESLNMRTVKNRIISFLGQDALVKDLLTTLYDTRNSLVHRGTFPDEDGLKEVNLLKYIVERVINRLFQVLRICPDKANLERYYQLVSANNSELTDSQRLIRYIQSKR